jgi:hypothetical protein
LYACTSKTSENTYSFQRYYYARKIDTRNSLLGFVFTLFGTTITWKANQQLVVSLSSTLAEYIALVEEVKESMWLNGMIRKLGIN